MRYFQNCRKQPAAASDVCVTVQLSLDIPLKHNLAWTQKWFIYSTHQTQGPRATTGPQYNFIFQRLVDELSLTEILEKTIGPYLTSSLPPEFWRRSWRLSYLTISLSQNSLFPCLFLLLGIIHSSSSWSFPCRVTEGAGAAPGGRWGLHPGRVTSLITIRVYKLFIEKPPANPKSSEKI